MYSKCSEMIQKLRFILFFFIPGIIISQQFERLPAVDLKGGYNGFSSFVDYNSDGLLDVFVTGVDFDQGFTNAVLYTNNGDETYTESAIVNIPRVIYGDLSWGDFDNNGTLDLLYAGTTSGFEEFGTTKIYRNIGKGCEFEELSHEIPGLSNCTLDWIDIDNDGFLDIYFHGINTLNEFEQGIFRNLGDGSFFRMADVALNPISGSDGNATENNSEWADFDNDGLKDLLVAMSSDTEFRIEVYKNLGDFEFERMDTSLPDLSYTQLKTEDVNNDGLLDIVLIGSTNVTLTSGDADADLLIFLNNDNFSFNEVFRINNVGVFISDLDMGDFNNDGFVDIACYGTGASFRRLRMFTNNGNNTFSEFNHSLLDCNSGGISFGDIDNDNDLDVLYYGRIQNPFDEEVTYIYKNTLADFNLPQQILYDETCSCNNEVRFSLDKSVDSINWNFGDINSGADNFSSLRNPVHTFSASGTYTVNATFTKGSATDTLSIIVIVEDTFSINSPDNIEVCDTDGDGEYQFNFNQLLDASILGNLDVSNFEVSYFLTAQNANDNLYALTMPYTNSNSNEIIYVRVQRKANPDCYRVVDFGASISIAPFANSIANLTMCDDDNDGIVSSFDTSNIESLIVGNQTNILVSYFDESMNLLPSPLPNPLANSIPFLETITVRVEDVDNFLCYNETSFDLVVSSALVAGSIQNLSECDNDGDGISSFDTSDIEDQVVNGQQGVVLVYTDGNGNLLDSPLPNPLENSIPFSEVITVRIERENDPSCFDESSFTLNVDQCDLDIEDTTVNFPKYFTPNGDGSHDFWQVNEEDADEVSLIYIYNRNGKLIKNLTPGTIGWDGTYNSRLLPSSEYWYKAILSNNLLVTGHFSLIR